MGSPLGGPAAGPSRATGVVRVLLDHSAVRYLLVGGCAFLIDLGVLALCYRLLGMPLWLATAAGFWTSFFFNFFVQRRVSFAAAEVAVVSSLWRYGALLAVNTVVNVVVVELFERSGAGFVAGKVVVTVAQTVWNYVAYRHWVFRPPAAREDAATEPDRPTP